MESRGFDYIKNAYRYFTPHTPRAALRAIEQGLLPPEAYLYWANSVKPLYQEPFDTYEIERILARKEIDLDTLLLINRILEKLIVSKDPETALFAAESLNGIEMRFTKKIEALRAKLEEAPNQHALIRDLGRTYYEFALVSGGRKAIRNFYLKEAYEQIKQLTADCEQPYKEDYTLLARILLELRIFSQAQTLLEKALETFEEDPDIQLMLAETSFYLNDFSTVITMCENLKQARQEIDPNSPIHFWSLSS
jgi:tetratricopeptide (TPR) repeat protein